MQVNKITTTPIRDIKNNTKKQDRQNNKPSFKSLGTMADGFSLGLANLVENGGLFVSFTIQDMLGTNLPRPIMGLRRNKKENKGQKNLKFAAKELVREMLTGPSMFIIPMIMLGIGKKTFGKSINIPAKLIKGLGEIHMAEPLKNGKAITQSEFYQNTFTTILKNAKKELIPSEETIKKAAEYTKTLEEGMKNNKTFKNIFKKALGKTPLKNAINQIGDDFADIAKNYTDDIVHSEFTKAILTDKAQAPIKGTIPHIISYADDVITKAGKQAPENISKFIEKTINKKTVGRVAMNAVMFAAVLGFLQVIPKLYNKAEGKNNAGLKGLMKEETLNDNSADKKTNNKPQTSFGQSTKTKNPSFGSLSTLSNTLTNSGLAGKIAGGIEFEGCNLSFPLLLGVMGLGILFPRIRQAKDKYDKEEIIRRDVTTCATMCFAEKWLRKGFSKINENKSGFVLTEKGKDFGKRNIFDKILQYLKPINGVQILSTDQIISRYSNIDKFNGGISGFMDYIEGQKGDIKKILSTSDIKTRKGIIEGPKKIVEEIVQEKLKKPLSEVTNSELKETLTSVAQAAKASVQTNGGEIINSQNSSLIEKYNKLIDLFKNRDNALVHKAKTLNARFTALSIVLIVPLFLGFALPAINEHFTKKRIRKENEEKEASINNIIKNSPFNKENANSIFSEIANMKK